MFPLLLSVALLGVAGVLLWIGDADEIIWSSAMLRPSILILGSIVAFGLSIETLGLVPAILAMSVLAMLGRVGARPREVVGLTAFLIVISVSIFVLGLGLQLDLMWR